MSVGAIDGSLPFQERTDLPQQVNPEERGHDESPVMRGVGKVRAILQSWHILDASDTEIEAALRVRSARRAERS
jgi:hypothetical protein